MRRDAREAVYRYLYSYLLTGEKDDGLKTSLYAEHKLNDKDVAFADTLICDIFANEKEINDSIADLVIGYTSDRINYLDRTALMIGMCEIITTNTDLPVVVDEAVNLVKKYSVDSSASFVNGILAQFAKRRNE